MALKSPQQMQVTPLEATPGTRFQSSIAPKIDTGFIDVLSKKVSEDEQLRVKRVKDNFDFNKADFKNKADALRIQAQSDIALQEGVNSIKETPKLTSDFRKKLEKTRNDFPSSYHQYLDQEIEESVNSLNTMAVPHMFGQMKKVKEDTYKTRLSNDMNFVKEKSGDLNYLSGEGLAKVENSAQGTLELKYGKDRNFVINRETGATAGMMIDEGTTKAKSETILGAITLQAKLPTGFANAENIYNNLDHEMTPADKVKALGFINTAREKGESNAAIQVTKDAIEYAQGNMVKAKEYAIAHTTDKQLTRVSAFLNDHFATEKKQKAKELDDNVSNLNQKAIAFGQIPREELDKLPVEEQNKWLKKWNDNGGKVIPSATNYAVYSKLNDAIHSMSPEDAKKFKLAPYLNDLAPEQAETMQRVLNDKANQLQDSKDKAQNSSLKDVRDITSMFIAQNPELMPEQIGRVKELAYLESERLKSDKNITIPQLRARLYQAIKKGIFEEKTTPGRFWGTNTETVMRETFAPDTSKIHESHKLEFRKQVMAKFKRLPTPAEENTQLERLIREGKDLSIPR